MDSFFGIGIFELFLIAVIALVVLGPERLPGAMRTVAGYFRQIREVSSEFTSQFSEEIKMLEEMDPRRMINDALDPSKTPTSSTNTTKPAAKPAPAKPATTSNAAKSAAAAAAVAKNAAQPLASEENTMLPPKADDAPQDGASAEAAAEVATENLILPPEKSKPAEPAKSAAATPAANAPAGNGTTPHADNPAEPKAAASAEE